VKVLHLASGRLYGGIERMLATMAESADVAGSLVFEFALASDARLAEELRDRAATVHALGDVRLSRPASVMRARHRLRTLLRERGYAAVICHAPWSHAIFGSAVRAAGAACVLWQHDRANGKPLVERASRSVSADLVVCNSRWTAQTAAVLQPDAPHRVIYCAVAAPRLSPGERTLVRSELGADPGNVVVMSASRMEPWKGHLDLIRALAGLSLQQWTLWIAGGAQRLKEREYASVLEGEVRRLGVERRVKFLGERRDVRRLLTGADLLAQANVGPEPFGIIFAEALLAGVPVVTTSMGGAPEIVAESCGRLVPPGNIAALSAALDELMSDAPLRAALGAAGPAHASARCDPAVVLPQLEAALLSLSVPSAA
jgi:glycosyltransferase involved in cell wall biosynthesis